MEKTIWGPGLAILLASLGTSIANVALPSIAADLKVATAQVQWVVILYLLAVTVGSVSAGRLGDAQGHGWVLRIGVILFVAAAALAACAPNLWLLLLARAFQGAAAAVMMTLPLALLRDRAPKQVGQMAGMIGTLSALGTAAGPSLGGVLIAGFGWRAPFVMLAALGLLALLMIERTRPAPQKTAGDLAGALALALTLATYTLALTLRGAWMLPLLAASGAAFALFCRIEAQSPNPLIAPAALQDRGLWQGLTISAGIALVMMGTLIVGPFYLSQGLGLGPAAVGLVMSAGPVISALFGLPAGRLSDRFGATMTRHLGLGLMFAGALGLAVLPGLAGYLAGIALLTSGYQLVQAANTAGLLGGTAAAQRGVISGLITLSRNLGLICGAAVLGGLYVWAGDPVLGLRACFALAACILAICAALAWRK